MNEFNTEKFIQQYEHIKKLQLLTDEEIFQLKRKRAQFEVCIKSTKDVKQFIEYIKYESVLMKKFKQISYDNENDKRSLDRSISNHIKEIYKLAIKKFHDNRELWLSYIEFAKIKFPNTVTKIYQQMLGYHHNQNDYIEAAQYEMEKNNYYIAINFLIQGINNNKNSSELAVLNIECYLRQAEHNRNEKDQEKTLLQVSEFYNKYLKSSNDINVYIDLLKRIQNIPFSLSFQNEIISYLLLVFSSRPEIWDFLGERQIDGLIFPDNEFKNIEEIPFETRLIHTLTIYDKSLEMVDDQHKMKMYDLYLTKLMELDSLIDNKNKTCHKLIMYAFGKNLKAGYKENCLSEIMFIKYINLRILKAKKFEEDIEEIFLKGLHLYPHSLEFYEITIKYFFSFKQYESISKFFKYAIQHNPEKATELYGFLCKIYLQNSEDNERAKKTMMEAIESNNKKLSAYFQPYILEYYAFAENIKTAREIYAQILDSKNVISLSLEFFKAMIKIESAQLKPDEKIIRNCFERGTKFFGHNNPDIWLHYIKYSWENGKYSEVDSIKKRAINAMKGNLNKINEFELKYTNLRIN